MSANMTDSEIRECYRLHWMPGWREPSKEWEKGDCGSVFKLTIAGSELTVRECFTGNRRWWECRAKHPESHWTDLIGIGNGRDGVQEFSDSKVARLIGEASMIARAKGCYLGKRSFELFATIPNKEIDPLAEKRTEERIEAGVARRREIEERYQAPAYPPSGAGQSFASDAAFQAVYSGGFSRKGFK